MVLDPNPLPELAPSPTPTAIPGATLTPVALETPNLPAQAPVPTVPGAPSGLATLAPVLPSGP
jgi:hypothetical protein